MNERNFEVILRRSLDAVYFKFNYMHISLLSSNGERVGNGGWGHFETVKNVKPGEDDSKQNLTKNFILEKISKWLLNVQVDKHNICVSCLLIICIIVREM